MNARALFAVSLVFLCTPSLRANDHPDNAPRASTPSVNQQASPGIMDPSQMSPRQVAELRGDILMAEKDYEGAVKMYVAILATDRSDAHLLNKLGVACEQLNETRQAEHYFKQSMKADKTFVSPVNNLGTLEYSKGNYGKAIQYYKKAVKLRDDLGAVYSNLGYAYFGKKDYVEAMTSFQKAIAVDPEVFSHHGGAGSILQQRSATDPGLFYFLVAKTYAEGGDAEQAAHYLKLARDSYYKDFLSAEKDPAFAKVINDPRVQEVLVVPPSYAGNRKTMQN